MRPMRISLRAFRGPVLTLSVVGSIVFCAGTARNAPSAENNSDLQKDLARVTLVDSSTLKPQKALTEKRTDLLLLDFWATWCAPCLQAIPRIESLGKVRRSGRGVRVLSVTDEPIEDLRRFSTRHALPSNMALDPERILFRRFEVVSRPHCVLLDGDSLLFSGHPNELDPSILVAGLEGKPLPIEADSRRSPARSVPAEGLISLTLRDSESGQFSSSSSEFEVLLQGHTLEQLVSYAFDCTPQRVKFASGVDAHRRLDFELKSPRAQVHAADLLARALAASLGIKAERVEEMTPALLIQILDGRTPAFRRPMDSTQRQLVLRSDGIHGVGDIKTAWRFMEYAMAMPVVDHSSLAGSFEIELSWQRGDLASLQSALAPLGLSAEVRVLPTSIVRVTLP